MRRTKIVATIGPASDNPDVVARMLDAGMDVVRLNFSHGTHAYHARNIAMLRNVAAQAGRPLTIIQDLQGPKIRTGSLVMGRSVSLKAGNPFRITTTPVEGTAECVSTTYEALPYDVRRGDRILISDGLIELRVLSTSNNDVETEIVTGGKLREKQGINLPFVQVSAPSLTEKDRVDLDFGLAHDIDYIALSFVRRASDISDIKARIADAGKDTPVVAKIEKPEALNEITEIVRLADAIMVARGDLGVEIPTEQVPPAQKMLIDTANDAGIPVITATQMLESMTANPRPTRAEASDVANAILDGTDAVMLSGETAVGHYPVDTVTMMGRIIEAAEASGRTSQHTPNTSIAPQRDIPNAVSEAARAIVEALPVKAIVAFTLSGRTAWLMAHQRPKVPIIALTPSEHVFRRLNLIWGITPIWTREYTDDTTVVMHQVHQALGQCHLLTPGNIVVLVGGHPRAEQGPTNFLQIVTVGAEPPSLPDLEKQQHIVARED